MKISEMNDSDKVRYSLYRRSDDRLELLRRFTGGKDPRYSDIVAVREFIRALAETVGSRRKTVLTGLGTFQWLPWKGRTPDGKERSSFRLVFKLTRSHKEYKGE